jgi:hypothetical protein
VAVRCTATAVYGDVGYGESAVVQTAVQFGAVQVEIDLRPLEPVDWAEFRHFIP